MLHAVLRRRNKTISSKANLFSRVVLSLLVVCILLAPSANCRAGELDAKIGRILGNATNSSVVAVDLATGASLVEINAAKPFKPASVLKLLVSVVALKQLGPSYTFKTSVYIEPSETQGSDKVFVRGGGDPAFTTESAWMLARRLVKSGVSKVDSVIVDDSLFVDPQSSTGQRAYQGGSSALCFNYNSVEIYICPSGLGRPAHISIDPWEVGFRVLGSIKTVAGQGDNFMVDASGGKDLRVSGSMGVGANCAQVYRSVANPSMVAAEFLAKTLERLGLGKNIKASLGGIFPGATLLFSHASVPLRKIVEDMNLFSSNIIADELVFALGETDNGSLSHATGLVNLARYIVELGYPSQEFRLVDGSGLSHENRISARILVRLLQEGWKDEGIRPVLEASLPVSGDSGTLKRRSFLGNRSIVRAKTGTIDGVSSLAGYLITENGRRIAFAVLQNGAPAKDAAVEKELQVVEAILAGT